MNIRPMLAALMLVAVAVLPCLAEAEDIDIYSTLNSGTAPNVLIVLDNAANFSASAGSCTYDDSNATPTLSGTAGGWEQCAMNNVINSLPVNSDGSAALNLGIMIYNASGFTRFGCDSSGNGGCLAKPIAPMTATNKSSLMSWIKTWDTSGNGANNIKANTEATGASIQEAWAYFAGKVGISGRNYANITPSNSGCQKDFVIFIGNAFTSSGTPGDGSGSSPSTWLRNAPNATTAHTTPITIPSACYGSYGSKSLNKSGKCDADTSPAFTCGSYSMGNHTDPKGLYADEWARYMNQVDITGDANGTQFITTYTIGLLGPSCAPDYPALLSSMAKNGGGKYFPATGYDEIKKALAQIFNEVQAVSSVFASSSLPASVNSQGSYLNQVYMGMFRPDAAGKPRWVGNLKQYQFVKDSVTKNLYLADKTGAPAISSAGTGFVSPNAVSFWTVKDTGNLPDSTGGFWKNAPQGSGRAYDSPDGEVVEKGGVAQQLRQASLTSDFTATSGATSSPRRLYTYCPSGSSCVNDLTNAANAFNSGNAAITAGALGVAATDRTNLINWVRGQDNAGDENGPGSPVTVRPSIHGDVVHSHPVVVSYGGDPESVVVFYGSNDGVFHAVNGSASNAIGSVPAGGELWGLVLPEFFGKLNRQRINTPVIKLATTDASLNPQSKDYFVDGSVGVFQQLSSDRKSSQKVYIYLSMRRGGRFIYALDVTSPTAPKVLWKKSYTDTGMGELGQTWSLPRIASVRGYANPVVIFGAGYSATQDSEPPLADTMGRGIFILDATNGNLVWSATPQPSGSTSCSGTTTSATCLVSGMSYSIPADMALLDRDLDGYVDRLYATDVGGNIWRVDLEPNAGNTPDKWQVNKLAALGCNSGVCASGVPRKFFYPPSIVPVGAANGVGSYDIVTIGSGDREHPLYSNNANSAYAVTNRLYVLKDKKTGKDGSGLVTITESSLVDVTTTTYTSYTGTNSGFYYTLAVGEKAINAPKTLSSVSSFGTNQAIAPSGASCNGSLGTARNYGLNVFTGASSVVTYDGGGMPPSPVSGIVTLGNGSNSEQAGFCIGCAPVPGGPPDKQKCNSALENCYVDVDGGKKMMRTYWYKR